MDTTARDFFRLNTNHLHTICLQRVVVKGVEPNLYVLRSMIYYISIASRQDACPCCCGHDDIAPSEYTLKTEKPPCTITARISPSDDGTCGRGHDEELLIANIFESSSCVCVVPPCGRADHLCLSLFRWVFISTLLLFECTTYTDWLSLWFFRVTLREPLAEIFVCLFIITEKCNFHTYVKALFSPAGRWGERLNERWINSLGGCMMTECGNKINSFKAHSCSFAIIFLFLVLRRMSTNIDTPK